MQPQLRQKLKSVSMKNKSLQDILLTQTFAKRVISVESVIGDVHNTKLIVETLTGEQRVHFYRRLDLKPLLNGVEITGRIIQDIINELNLQGYDFTEDDLELVDRILTAKPTSLGYVGALGNAVGPREISCDGAVTSIVFPELSGVWDIELDGSYYDAAERDCILVAISMGYNIQHSKNWKCCKYCEY
jgi:hypothetical protein